jgi:hypothetical protein
VNRIRDRIGGSGALLACLWDMRRFTFLFFIAVFACLGGVSFASTPMEFRELRLLVQGRVPEGEIMADLQRRKLAKALTEDEKGELVAAGAGRNLMAAVARPDLLVSAQAAAKYEADKARNAQRAKLLSQPRVWILGEITRSSETGDTFVHCSNLCRNQVPAGQQKPDELVHFPERPPAFRLAQGAVTPVDHIAGQKGPFYVNCMAAIAGLHEHTMAGDKVQTVQEVVMIESLAPTANPYGITPAAAQAALAGQNAQGAQGAQPVAVKRPPVTKRATLPIGQWVTLSKYGGPNALMKINNIQMTFLTAQIDKTGAVKEIKVDNSGRTLIFDDGKGCRTFYVYDISTPSDSGLFEFQHTPESASYPKE